MRVAIVTHYALRIRDMLGPPQGRAFSVPRKGLASPEVRCGCTVGILSPWAARGMRRFCTRGRVNAATTSLTRAPNSRNSGAAPWAPFFCMKERLAASGSLAWALLGRPLGAGWFCMRGMVAAAIPSLTHALDSRNSGAAPGRPVCVRKEGLPSSEVRCGRSMGQPPILGRPGGGLVLYEGRGLGRIGALKPGPDLAKSLGRPAAGFL